MKGLYVVIGKRVLPKVKFELAKIGLYVYSIRYEDGVETLEHAVLVNHLDDIVSNIKIDSELLPLENWEAYYDSYNEYFEAYVLDMINKIEKQLLENGGLA